MTRSLDCRVAFRLTHHEREIIMWAAAACELTVSQFVRGSALERASHILVDEHIRKKKVNGNESRNR